eukprot:Gregarina_sp_Pseudo_9__579@NODE_1371_length_1656_cov_319_529375_g1280_i0_p2_GENE_NODE_1371_length_1656_cov_319_529375_g1280_i0NODE_1371_length_1656_cov_319_529375_g1280_i0_p2_ORF_typecomplete_len140_score17_91Phage_holin_3_6/PF07332_11/0_0013DUF2561/PF10812_8/0_0041PIRT/PF15099_6/0_0063DcuC/PF03606_15/4_7e02DcuC/PF03606_15/0_0091HisKA_7TM/PF16927_5/0_016PgaD/PF13994_6/0_018MFS_4/PF06779_14/0_01712TM_1/PF09847_9/0_019SfLAP/PF11139_8/0_033DUF872/PF05915_12/0_035DUF2207/PF09972_9/0_058TMEM171/PF154
MGMCSKFCWAWCCILYFVFAAIFLTVLGVLCAQDSYLSVIKEEVRTKAAGPVFIALGIYGVLAIISAVYLVLHARKVKRNPPKTAFEASREARKERLGTATTEVPVPVRPPSLTNVTPMEEGGDANANPQRGQSLLNED